MVFKKKKVIIEEKRIITAIVNVCEESPEFFYTKEVLKQNNTKRIIKVLEEVG